jgi:hypothetical protein
MVDWRMFNVPDRRVQEVHHNTKICVIRASCGMGDVLPV